MAGLFKELPLDVNILICQLTSGLDLDLKELWHLRQVSKTWKQAVEEGHLGEAGRSYGKVLTEAQSSGVWVDIPESTVVVNEAVYVLSEPKRAPSDVYARVRRFRLRSFDLSSQKGCWKEKSSLQFTEEEAPLSPSAEGFIMGEHECAAQTSFSVVASQRYIFVMHFAIPRVDSSHTTRPGWYAMIASAHANLYDTLTDTWRPFNFNLPNFLWPPYSDPPPSRFWRMVRFYRGRKLADVLCAATEDAVIFIHDRKEVWFHSLAEGELDQPWESASFIPTDGEPQPREKVYYSAVTASSGVPNAICISSLAYTGPDFARCIRKIVRTKPTPKRRGANEEESLSSMSFTAIDEIDWVWPTQSRFEEGSQHRNVDDLHDVHGDVLILSEGAGMWQGSKKHVEYRKPFKDVFVEPVGEVLWSRLLPTVSGACP
ncbi:hypothetical protein KFL_004020040 [Klebsormidium nitens]|uniref:F-box domain-containing protein n=1 Tax=Klebsormidium nitens TaxID=105231 RepID=A0A1Y1IIZ3_KLENI|nr:hypothetical protein KFL_004020040 [Klebsormidium nitens]|eukprot:GAQ88118.1 hypothetical protein KFL_004020040 [Klebsormidium nitens]